MTSTDFHVEAIDRLCFVCGFIIMKNGHHILLVLKEAMSLTFDRSINLLENVTSNNICHSCWTQRCPLFRGVRYSEVFTLGFALIPAVPRKCARYSEASPLLQAFTLYTSEVSIELQTSVVETIYICLKWSHMYIYSD